MSTKRLSLKEKLNRIYNTVDLRTTCNGKISCCKVAMPSHNYSEFVQILNEIWNKENDETKVQVIQSAIEYFFKYDYDKWGMATLLKPCMLLDDKGKCSYYENRPLSCRLYGLWPESSYKARVDKFEKAYEGKLTRDQLPLNTQCPNVKRVDDSVPLTQEIIQSLFSQLDELDLKMQKFTNAQITNRENYRTFHDWFLWTFFGEQWLSTMTDFILKATKEQMEDQLKAINDVVKDKFAKNLPDMRIKEDND